MSLIPERVFSQGRLMETSQRNSLHGSVLEVLLCLKDCRWFKAGFAKDPAAEMVAMVVKKAQNA